MVHKRNQLCRILSILRDEMAADHILPSLVLIAALLLVLVDGYLNLYMNSTETKRLLG